MENYKSNFDKFGNIMIDIESLSTSSDAAVIAIAAVEFNKYTGEVGDKLELFIKPSDWFTNNRKASGDTLIWWFNQDKECKDSVMYQCLVSEFNTESALKNLSDFVRKHDSNGYFDDEDKNVTVWGNGSIMDISILQNLYEAYNIPIPWKYWAVNDVRTIVDLNPKIKEETEFEGVKHDPLNDCLHQIKYLSKTIQSLNIKPILYYERKIQQLF